MEIKNKCVMMKSIEHVETMCVTSVVEAPEDRGALVVFVDLVKF